MFLAVIAGYLVAALFAFCGLYNVIVFLTNLEQTAGATAFVNGTALAAWPLAVAAVVYILTRIAILLENQEIISSDFAEQQRSHTEELRPQTKRPIAPAPLPSGSYFHATPVAQPSPSITQPSHPRPAEAAPALDEVASIAASAAEEAEQEAASTEENTAPVIKRRNDGLSFFRVD